MLWALTEPKAADGHTDRQEGCGPPNKQLVSSTYPLGDVLPAPYIATWLQWYLYVPKLL